MATKTIVSSKGLVKRIREKLAKEGQDILTSTKHSVIDGKERPTVFKEISLEPYARSISVPKPSGKLAAFGRQDRS